MYPRLWRLHYEKLMAQNDDLMRSPTRVPSSLSEVKNSQPSPTLHSVKILNNAPLFSARKVGWTDGELGSLPHLLTPSPLRSLLSRDPKCNCGCAPSRRRPMRPIGFTHGGERFSTLSVGPTCKTETLKTFKFFVNGPDVSPSISVTL